MTQGKRRPDGIVSSRTCLILLLIILLIFPPWMFGDQIGWALPYEHRFPNPQLAKLIANGPTLSVYYLGGLPPKA